MNLPKIFLRAYEHCLKPLSVDEDDRRRELILNIILAGIIILLTILVLTVLYDLLTEGSDYEGAPLRETMLVYSFFLGLYLLSRRGYFVIAAYFLIALYLCGATYSAYHWGIDLPSALLSYAVIIVISSILISPGFSFYLAATIAIIIGVLGYIQSNFTILPNTHWKNGVLKFVDAVEYASTLFFITLVSWLSNREIGKALLRRKQSELALKLERDSLETKVEERTRELKRLQLAKMAELYRFAEFGRLSSGIFHDLINPLTAVDLNVSKLRNDSGSVLETKSYLEKAVKASVRMRNFLEAVEKQISMDDFENYFCLNEEIKQSLELLGFKARQKNIILEFDNEEEIYSFGNPLKFNQLVTNLVSNAIDSYDQMETGHKTRLVKIELKLIKNQIYLSVKDTGAGILPALQEKIFDPFFTTKSAYQGIGLGLSTTKEVVEKYFGGKIEVRSELGNGSIFIVEIPLRKEGKN